MTASSHEALSILHSVGKLDMGAAHGECHTTCFNSPLPALDERTKWHLNALLVVEAQLSATVEPVSVTANLDVAGSHRIHPLLSINRLRNDIVQFPHLCKFASHVPFDFISPAQVTAVMCIARLFPQKWAWIYSDAFHSQRVPRRVAVAVDRYNHVFLPPGPRELLEIVELFRTNMWPSELQRAEFVDAQMPVLQQLSKLVPQIFAASSKSDIYRLTAALIVIAGAVDESELNRLFGYVIAAPRVLKRHCQSMMGVLRKLDSASDATVSHVFAQFKIKPRTRHTRGTFGRHKK